MFYGAALIAAVAFAGWRYRAAGNRLRPRDWSKVVRGRATDAGDVDEPSDLTTVSNILPHADHTEEAEEAEDT
jgi:hypothetical protein